MSKELCEDCLESIYYSALDRVRILCSCGKVYFEGKVIKK